MRGRNVRETWVLDDRERDTLTHYKWVSPHMYTHTQRERDGSAEHRKHAHYRVKRTSITHTGSVAAARAAVRKVARAAAARVHQSAQSIMSTFHQARHTHSGAQQMASRALHRRPTCTWGDSYAQCAHAIAHASQSAQRRQRLGKHAPTNQATSHTTRGLSPSLSSLSSLTLPSLVSHLPSLRALASSLAIFVTVDAYTYPRTFSTACGFAELRNIVFRHFLY